VTERFAGDWLKLREPFDHAARSVALARRLADRLPARPRLLDLGAGTGSLFRFMAPIIGRRQDWILVDSDAALLDEAFGRTAAWARRQGFAATAPGDALLVSTPHGLWQMQALQRDVMATKASASTGELEADAVLCSALLDLVSAPWLERLFDTLRVPFLASLTIDGRDAWPPHHPNDAVVRASFRHDLRRDKGFGAALGTTAVSVALKALTTRGFVTSSAPTDWHVPRNALRMQRALIEGTADGARNARPSRARVIAEWQEARLRQAVRARLAIRIGHRDILAIPPVTPSGG
jgi:SAM-dependent methyltransferase